MYNYLARVMKNLRYVLLTALAMVTTMIASAQVTFLGNGREIYEETPAANTGLNHIYVLYDTQGVSMVYNAGTDPDDVTWLRFGEQGGAYATEVEGIVRSGNITTLPQVEANCGYIIEEGTDRTYLWVVDYSKYRLALNSAMVDPESDCGTTTIHVVGSGSDIVYYTINGGRRVLDRQIKIKYNTLTWDAENAFWKETPVEETEESFKPAMAVPAPYCNTTFTIEGDKLLKFWGEAKSVTTDEYSTVAINVETTAVQEERDNDNEQKTDGSFLGGSAPAHITFTAHCTHAVTYKEWQVSDTQEFTNLLMTFSQDEVDYTFDDAGTTYWRFYGANSDGSCEYYSDTYTVNIGESVLLCPNIFLPGSTEEVNDVWKVSYKSIVEFHCWIFNRWGNKIIEFTDPSQGWDGTYKGKQVPAGVYFYVIRAKGSDGKEYKLSGDINILRYKRHEVPSATDEPEL